MQKYVWKLSLLVVFILILASCTEEFIPSGNSIVEKAIENHGGDLYKNSKIEFDFRGKHYVALRNKGRFSYERIYSDSTGNVKEYKNNMGVFREVNGESVELNQELKTRIGNGINSVIYFASLPYPLNDKAAVKEFIGMANMKDQPYYVVEVTFKAEGGGEDFEDRYIYWFHEETFSMDYLAYYFRVNGGGSRFRIMHNKRMINGITFTDHENYKSDEIGDNVEDYDTLFNNENIEKVSDINLENVSVEILK